MKKNSTNGFGEHVEYSMRTMACDALPVRTPSTTSRMNAHLSTNEWIDHNFTISDGITNPLDGYVIGVGFGHIFKMIDLFPEGMLPRAIICVDVQPEVVLTGRIIVQKLRYAQDKKSFFRSLYAVTPDEIDAVIQKEHNPEIAIRFLEAVPYIEELFSNAEYRREIGAYLTPSIVDVLTRNFDRLQQLAKSNNIGVVFIDIANIQLIQAIMTLPNYSTSRNIIYLSNAIDHITQRGLDMESINALDVLHALETDRGNVCVDTTQQSLHYKLRIGTLPPKYSTSDYPQHL